MLRAVSTGYPAARGATRLVTSGVNVTLRAGELTCLLGPNGAGKSTLMRTIAGTQPPLAGTVTIGDADVTRMSPKQLARVVSVVLTERVATGMLSAYGLVALGRHPHTNWLGDLTNTDHQAIRDAMTMAGAAGLAERLVGQLSDGERQRVMVARALAQDTRIMVLDEITAFLDLPRRVEIMSMLRQLAHDTRRALLLSTHDLDLALRASDRIWLLPKDGPLAVGAPEDLVLSGAFAEAFASEGVQFEPELGSFRIQSRLQGRIAVHASGLARTWTVRALERVGFRTADPPAPLQVRVEEEADGLLWLVTAGAGPPIACRSIEELIDTLSGSDDEAQVLRARHDA